MNSISISGVMILIKGIKKGGKAGRGLKGPSNLSWEQKNNPQLSEKAVICLYTSMVCKAVLFQE
jgi:hypothetical protein